MRRWCSPYIAASRAVCRNCRRDISRCRREARVAYGCDAGGRLCLKWAVGCRGRLAAEDGFYTGEKLVEVVECVAVSLDGLLPLVAYFVVATAHRALPDMRFKLTRECFAFHFLEFLLLVFELSSLIFSSRRCFWSRARAVSCTRSSYAFTSDSICLTRSGSRNQL